MTTLTKHRLLYILIVGTIYSMIQVGFDLELKEMTVGVLFTIASMTIWDRLLLKKPEWKDKYKGQF